MKREDKGGLGEDRGGRESEFSVIDGTTIKWSTT